MPKGKSTTAIAEALGEGEFWEFTMNGCHLPFLSEKALRQHFTQAHAAKAAEGWEAKSRRLVQRWSERIEETEPKEADMRGERNKVEERRREEQGENEGSEDGQAQAAIKAYRPSKGTAMGRFIEKWQSPQCPIDMAEVTDHLRETWSRPLENVEAADKSSLFPLVPRITE
jgi:hypothetical protein